MKNDPGLRRDERGFSAIVIAMILVLVLSLMTVGFAQLMRREQKSALDKQLSKQAYYAAETGLNDAAKAITSGYALAKDKCEPFTAAEINAIPDPLTKQAAATLGPGTNQISNETNSSYSCLIIDPAPKSLEYTSVDTEQSRAVPLLGVNAAAPTQQELISTLVISWDDVTGTGPFMNDPDTPFKTASEWRDNGQPIVPMLRISLTPLANGFIDRTSFMNSSFNAFLYPNNFGTAATTVAGYNGVSYGTYSGIIDSGGIVTGNCNNASTPRRCNIKISGLNSTYYLLNMRAIYQPAGVTITAYASSGAQLRIKNAQTLVDSTGKSQDVLRRVQARMPVHNGYDHPDFSLETTGDICKQLQLVPTASDNSNISTSACNNP